MATLRRHHLTATGVSDQTAEPSLQHAAFDEARTEEARAALEAVLDRIAMYAPHPVAMAASEWSAHVSQGHDRPGDRVDFMNTVRVHAGIPPIQFNEDESGGCR
jgi:hypothetical protein